MIFVFASSNEEVNTKVRGWLVFHGFFYYPSCAFITQVKGMLGAEENDLLVIEYRTEGVWGAMRVQEGNWKERDEMYRKFRVDKSAMLVD